MGRNKGTKKKIQLHESVQFKTGKPHPDLPGFPEMLNGVVMEVMDGGMLTVMVGEDVHTILNKKCLKLDPGMTDEEIAEAIKCFKKAQ